MWNYQLITDAYSTRPRQFASGPVFWEREGKLRIAGFVGQGRVARASFTALVIDRDSVGNFQAVLTALIVFVADEKDSIKKAASYHTRPTSTQS